jgi:hypothetical protein
VSKRTLSLSLLLAGLAFLVCPSPRAAMSQPSPAVAVLVQSAGLCPALPAPVGNVVHVSTASELVSAVNGATSGDTILLADGSYDLDGQALWIDVPGVTIRSASGNRDAAVIDGHYVTTEIVTVAASNVTVADLTLRRARTHPIHVVSTAGGSTLNTRIYNVHIVDPGQQAIKINPHVAQVTYADGGEIACSHIELTDAGRPWVWSINGSCYTGGVDAHQARDWTIRDNRIEGFWCNNDLAEHGIHMWRGCRDTIVERNVLVDNARGVGFGLATSGVARTYTDDPCPGVSGYVDHYGGVIRNNVAFAGDSGLFASEYGFDCGLCFWQACGARALHNTVYSSNVARSFSSIEWRFSNTHAEIANNLVNYAMMERDGASATLSGNVVTAQPGWFVDAGAGDLHLSAGAAPAIDHGEALAAGLCDDDLDGDLRPIGPARDVGADEYGVSVPEAVTNLRVTRAVTGTGVLTVTLRWTAPAGALTTTLRYDGTPIAEDTWSGASPLPGTLPGATSATTATVPYEGGTVYWALRSENAGGLSALSNNAFWPHWDVLLAVLYNGQ